MTKNDILILLNTDKWFRPGKGKNTIEMIDSDGNKVNVSRSYYHIYNNGDQMWLRVSEHGTYLKTWLKRIIDPTKSLQNLSIIFSDEPVSSDLKTEKELVIGNDGRQKEVYTYFVVEQYWYHINNLSKNDFKVFTKKLKSLGNDNVFTDPLKKKSSKRASRSVLEPQKEDGTVILPSTNPVHPRQTAVANNKDYEIDAGGNIIEKRLFVIIDNIITEEINKLLSK